MLLYQSTALLRPPMGFWSAVDWQRPAADKVDYQDMSHQFRLDISGRDQKGLDQVGEERRDH